MKAGNAQSVEAEPTERVMRAVERKLRVGL